MFQRRGIEPVFRRFVIETAYRYKTGMRFRNDPHQIALEFSIGAFIVIFSTFGLGLVFVTGLAVWFEYHIPAAVIGSVAANPIKIPVWIYLSCKTGNAVFYFLGFKKMVIFKNDVFKRIFNTSIDIIIGNTIILILIAVAGYFSSLEPGEFQNRKNNPSVKNSCFYKLILTEF